MIRLICAKFVTGSRPGHDRQADAERLAAVAEAEEVVVVVEQLRDDDVGAGIDFALEIGEVDLRARCFLVRFRIAGHGDAKFGKLAADERDQFVGVAKPAGHRPECGVSAGGSPRRATTFSTFKSRAVAQVFAKLVHGATDAGEMRRHRQLKFAVDAGDDFERQLLRRAAGAVGAGDEAGPKFDQPGDMLEQTCHALRRLRRKQLERQAEFARPVCGGKLHRKSIPWHGWLQLSV